MDLPPSIAPTLSQLDIAGALGLAVLGIVFTFFLVDLLDNTGALIATTHPAGLMRPDGTVPNLGRALQADSGGAIIGATLGTFATVSHIESAAGIQAGGRMGLAAVVVAALFLAPLATSIPAFATAPAVVFVACPRAQALRGVAWDDPTNYVPAVITTLAMPFTFSIASGIGLGFIPYALLRTIGGRPRRYQRAELSTHAARPMARRQAARMPGARRPRGVDVSTSTCVGMSGAAWVTAALCITTFALGQAGRAA